MIFGIKTKKDRKIEELQKRNYELETKILSMNKVQPIVKHIYQPTVKQIKSRQLVTLYDLEHIPKNVIVRSLVNEFSEELMSYVKVDVNRDTETNKFLVEVSLKVVDE